MLSSFNGLDIYQTKFFTKVLYQTYLTKILKGHNWLMPNASHIKSPMTSDSTILKSIYILTRPDNYSKTSCLQLKIGFWYRQVISELIFVAVTCRPDILFPTILLSQYSHSPAEYHYIAVKRIFWYLRLTISNGLHFLVTFTRLYITYCIFTCIVSW